MSKLWPPTYSDGTLCKPGDKVKWLSPLATRQSYFVLALWIDKDMGTNVTIYHPEIPSHTRMPHVNSRDLEKIDA